MEFGCRSYLRFPQLKPYLTSLEFGSWVKIEPEIKSWATALVLAKLVAEIKDGICGRSVISFAPSSPAPGHPCFELVIQNTQHPTASVAWSAIIASAAEPSFRTAKILVMQNHKGWEGAPRSPNPTPSHAHWVQSSVPQLHGSWHVPLCVYKGVLHLVKHISWVDLPLAQALLVEDLSWPWKPSDGSVRICSHAVKSNGLLSWVWAAEDKPVVSYF